MAIDAITIIRARVLTLWAAIVAGRLGFTHDEALTLGRAVAGLNAYSKGWALGTFKPAPKDVRAKREAKANRCFRPSCCTGRCRWCKRSRVCAGSARSSLSSRRASQHAAR
jgi:hypothetical protein